MLPFSTAWQLVLVDSSGYMSIFSFEKGSILVVKRLAQDPIVDILPQENTTHYAIILKVVNRPRSPHDTYLCLRWELLMLGHGQISCHQA
eukprot:scaffold9378_cov36-Prasinocladus_malaysianus.AAC.1